MSCLSKSNFLRYIGKSFLLAGLVLTPPVPLFSQTAIWQGFCQRGGINVLTSGLKSTATQPIVGGTISTGTGVQGSYPNCTVSVFIQGTVTLYSPLFADRLNTPLANPFTANTDGSFFFYAAVGTHVDITLSAGGLPANFTFFDQIIGGSAGAGSPIVLQTNGVNNTSQSQLNLSGTGGITVTNPSGGNVTIGGGAIPGGGAATPGVAFPSRFTYTFGRGDGILAYGHGVGAVGTQGNFSPTGTETSGRTVSSSAVGSANTVISTCSGMGANPGQDFLSYGTISRFSTRLETQTTTTARYWIGIMDLGAGECTSGNSTYASDTPNRSYCAFRFSTTTDTTWKAICSSTGASQTIVDTGVTPVTASSTLFEIFPGASSTTFFINGSLVATVASQQPAASAPVSFGFQGDNKNTATAETVVFFWDEAFESK